MRGTRLSETRPSETARGRRWLQNFRESDRGPAQLLIDSLDIVSTDELRFGLRDHIASLGDDDLPTVLIPVRPQEDLGEPDSRVHVAYSTYHPGSSIPVTPGSEALIGTAIRDLTGDRPKRKWKRWLHPGCTLKQLRRVRVRRLFLVTDYCGSGRQVVDFAQMFVRNQTLRSWRSFGWIQIGVVAYAASVEARERIAAATNIDHLSVVRPASSFGSAPWTDEERQAIVRLCTEYLLPDQRGEQFGYLGSAGLFATHSRVPNNVPLLLRQRGDDWYPFFKGRSVPPDLRAALHDYQGDADLVQIAEDSNQIRLSRAFASGRLKTPSGKIVATLALLARRRRTVVELSYILKEPEKRVQQFVNYLTSLELITDEHRLTDAGWRELRAAKRLSRVISANIEGREPPYYPQALR